MIKKLFLIFIFIFTSTNVLATTAYKFPAGKDGGPISPNPWDAIYKSCRNQFYALDPYTDVTVQLFNNSTLDTIGNVVRSTEPGDTTQLQCCTANSCLNSYVTKIETCDSFFVQSQLVINTTIASFAPNGDVVPTAYPSNPQCLDFCIQSHPGGVATDGVAYSHEGVPIAVGTQIWVVFRDNVFQSGQTCNYTGADFTDVAYSDNLPPLNWLNDLSAQTGNTGGSTGTASSGAALTNAQDLTLNNIYANTQTAISKLDNLDLKLDSLLNGTAVDPNGDPQEIDSGTFGLMPQPPVPVAPVGGLVAPSETGLNTFKSSISSSSERAAGVCPTWEFHVAFLSGTSTHGNYKFDQHCALVDSHRGALESVMMVVWSVAALALVFKA